VSSRATPAFQSLPGDAAPVPRVGLRERFISALGAYLRGLVIASLIALALWVVGTKAGVIPVKPGTTASNPYLGLPPEKIVEQGRSLDKRLSESSNPNARRMAGVVSAEQEEIEQTRTALRSINKAAPQYREAQRLLAGYSQHEVEDRKLLDATIAKAISDDVVEGRKAYADQLEKNVLREGVDAHFGVSGTKSTTLVVRYGLENRLFVYELLRLLNDTPLLEGARKQGFANIHFTNGRGFNGTYDVARSRWN